MITKNTLKPFKNIVVENVTSIIYLYIVSYSESSERLTFPSQLTYIGLIVQSGTEVFIPALEPLRESFNSV